MRDVTGRFSDRVADYVRYRPDYPRAIVETLREAGWLRSGDVVADIGSGTGIASRLFLDAGHAVIGIEPNRNMREAGEALFAGNTSFRSVNGRAEATGLADASVDLIVAAQAYHWFDTARAREEFLRVLRPPGRCALIWNERRTDTPFLAGYEELLVTFGTDYREVDHRRLDEAAIAPFFGRGVLQRKRLDNFQLLDHAALRGRLLSSSYAPGPDHPQHRSMLEALDTLFDAHARDGRVRLDYDVRLYFDALSPAEGS